MNLQSLVVVVLRLITLKFMLETIVMSVPVTLQLLRLHEPTPFDLPMDVWLIFGVLLAWSILLWIFALPVARLITSRLPQDISFGAMTLADWYSIAFIGVGLYYIAGYLASVLKLTCHLFKEVATCSGYSWMGCVDASSISQTFIPFIAGILLFVFGRKWAVMLAQKHAQVPSPVTADNEKHVSEN